MNTINKNYNITELLHKLTQKRNTITFNRDFQGMLTVSWGTELQHHEHLGVPYQDIKELEKQLASFLAKLDEGVEE